MPWFAGSQGRIHHDSWLPDGEARSVVVFLHGFGEHLGLYDAFARRLTADGHAVHALDCMGHGRSDGERGVITYDAYTEDGLSLVRLAAARHPTLPVVLAGHSAGALAAFLIALRHPALVDALVLSGGLGYFLDSLAEEEGEADVDPTTLLSTHPDYVHALLHDPLVHDGSFPTPMVESLARTWPEVQRALAAGLPALPVLLLHGGNDPVVPLAVSEDIASRLPRATLRVFAGDLHDVLNEHDRHDVHHVVAAALDKIPAPLAP